MKWSVVVSAWPYLVAAAGTTLWISLAGIALGLVIGVAICLCRVAGGALAARFGALYVSFFRGVPLLVQLLLVYDLLPLVGLNVPALVAAVASLGLASGAYVCEIFRGALTAVPRGQAEAALSLGFPGIAIWRRILLPQALRTALPPLFNEFILLLKASSLISVVGVAELTRVGMNIASSTYRPFEIYLSCAAIYLVLNGAIALLGGAVERRMVAA
jgi:polar amino acid transport system permease protein